MSKQTIFVTGATGNVGGATFKCLDKNKNKIKVGVHNASKATKLETEGAEVVVIDMDDKESLVKGFQGLDTVLAIPPSSETRAQQLTNTVEAAKQAGVKNMVMFSVLDVDERRILFQKQLEPGETALKNSGLGYIIARSPFFQDNFMGMKDEVKSCLRDGAGPLVAVHDLGRTLATLLENPETHLGKTYNLTGPAEVTGQDIAKAFSEVTGKEVRYVDFSPAEMKKIFMGLGFAEWQADGVLELLEDYAQKRYKVSNDIQKITGKAPRTIKETIQTNLTK